MALKSYLVLNPIQNYQSFLNPLLICLPNSFSTLMDLQTLHLVVVRVLESISYRWWRWKSPSRPRSVWWRERSPPRPSTRRLRPWPTDRRRCRRWPDAASAHVATWRRRRGKRTFGGRKNIIEELSFNVILRTQLWKIFYSFFEKK